MIIRILAAALALTAWSGFAAAGWVTDFNAAKEQARKEGKSLLIDFTGSDWCGYCIKLHDTVFSKKEFLEAASKDFVLVEIDRPRAKRLAPAIDKQNEELVAEYAIQGFPTVLLANPDGYPYARTGYQPVGPDGYVEHLKQFAPERDSQKQLIDAAEKLEGPAKAKAYDDLISWMGKRGLKGGVSPLVNAIITLDPTDSTKLRKKYEDLNELQRIEVAVNTTQDLDRALKDLTRLLGAKPEASVAQQAYVLRAMIQIQGKNDPESGMKSLRAAHAIDPNSELGKGIGAYLAQQEGGE